MKRHLRPMGRNTNLSDRIMALLKRENLNTNQIRERLGSTRGGVRITLHKLSKAGRVRSVGRDECRTYIWEEVKDA